MWNNQSIFEDITRECGNLSTRLKLQTLSSVKRTERAAVEKREAVLPPNVIFMSTLSSDVMNNLISPEAVALMCHQVSLLTLKAKQAANTGETTAVLSVITYNTTQRRKVTDNIIVNTATFVWNGKFKTREQVVVIIVTSQKHSDSLLPHEVKEGMESQNGMGPPESFGKLSFELQGWTDRKS
ncbi:uncharacterized protein V6R79_024328 [Siganus canaliculatus]